MAKSMKKTPTQVAKSPRKSVVAGQTATVAPAAKPKSLKGESLAVKKASPAKQAVAVKKKEAFTEKSSAAGEKKSAKQKSAAGFERVFEQIYRFVLRIPAGRVMTYGQIARLLDERYSPRLVGWAMHATPKDERNIPWHRVINSRGATSTGRLILHEPDLQRLLLEGEGVIFNDKGVCDLSRFQWSPAARKSKAPEKAEKAPTPKPQLKKTGKKS
jgi:methylated-DNA-protein-cysteine methyltransferase-like protein